MSKNNNKVHVLRQQAVESILAILKRNAIFEADFALGSTPIIIEDPYDCDNSFTLDRVYLEGDTFALDASSCFDNLTRTAEDLTVETLFGILDFLTDNEDDIWSKESDSVSAAIYDAVMEEYHKQDNCMGDFLAMNTIGDILMDGHPELAGFLAALSPEQLAELYMSLMHRSDGDEFYRENDDDDERINILDEKKEKLGDRNRVFVLFNEVNNDGVHNSDVIGTYRNADDAKSELRLRRDKFMEGLSEDEMPAPDGGDDFIDDDMRFLYYRFSENHLFSLVVRETKIR